MPGVASSQLLCGIYSCFLFYTCSKKTNLTCATMEALVQVDIQGIVKLRLVVLRTAFYVHWKTMQLYLKRENTFRSRLEQKPGLLVTLKDPSTLLHCTCSAMLFGVINYSTTQARSTRTGRCRARLPHAAPPQCVCTTQHSAETEYHSHSTPPGHKERR